MLTYMSQFTLRSVGLVGGFLAIILAVPLLSGGQQQRAPDLRINVQLAEIDATVLDPDGRFVAGLQPGDFVLKERGVPQKIDNVIERYDRSISVGILIDMSGSMGLMLSNAQAMAAELVTRVQRDDEVFILGFDGDVHVIANFTSDQDHLIKALRGMEATGASALYDGIHYGIDKMEEARHRRKAFVVLADGGECGGRISLDTVAAQVQSSEVAIYTIGLTGNPFGRTVPRRRRPELPRGPAERAARQLERENRTRTGSGIGGGNCGGPLDTIMEVLGAVSGGRSMLVETVTSRSSQEELEAFGAFISQIADGIEMDLRSGYTIRYYPSEPGPEPEWGTVQIEARDPSLRVRINSDSRLPGQNR